MSDDKPSPRAKRIAGYTTRMLYMELCRKTDAKPAFCRIVANQIKRDAAERIEELLEDNVETEMQM